jgi:D-alanyl-D-alanine carboxypeptidase
MRESNFVNPHGLPDDRQQTSARDMAILARALLREFPEHEDLFHIGAIQFGRRIMRNTNGLIGRYPGADGMKTGFICASGFNVVASAQRDGRRLITVILGSSSASERTLKAADLFDRGFGSKGNFLNPTLEALPASALQSPPNMRSVICDRRGPMPGEEDGAATVSATPEGGTTNPFGSLSSNVLAFAGGSSSEAVRRTTLGPRAPVQPVRVWIGLNPPTNAELAAQAAQEDAADQARKAKKGKKAVATKKAPADKAAEKSKVEASKKGRASASLKPVHGSSSADSAKSAAATKGKAAPVKADAKATPAAPAKKAEKPSAKKTDGNKAASANKS